MGRRKRKRRRNHRCRRRPIIVDVIKDPLKKTKTGVVNDAVDDPPRTDRFALVVRLVPQKKQSSEERRVDRKKPTCNDQSPVPDWIYTRRQAVLTPIAVTAGVVRDAYDDPPHTDRFALAVLPVSQKKQSSEERR